MGIEVRGGQIVEHVLRRLLLFAKSFEILVHLLSHPIVLRVQGRSEIDRLLEKHRILTQKFQFDFLIVISLGIRIELQMLHAKRATTHRISLLVRVLLPTHTQRQPIDHPHRRRQLPLLLTLIRQILLVIRSNLIDVPAKLRRLVVLGPIALPLKTALGRELHVLVLAVDIFGPLTEPLDGGIVTELSPGVAGHVAYGYRGAFGDVDHDLFGGDALFQFAHFGMFPASAEGAGGFHIVIPHLLQMTIDQTVPVLEHGRILHILIDLPFRIRNRLPHQFLFLQVFPYGFEVALFEILDHVFFAEDESEVGHEVFDEDGCRLWISEMHSFGIHGGEEGGGLLLQRSQSNLLPIVQHIHPMRFVRFRKRHARMLHLHPLTTLGRILGIPPQVRLHGVRDSLGAFHLFETLFLLRGRFFDGGLGLFFDGSRRRRRRLLFFGGGGGRFPFAVFVFFGSVAVSSVSVFRLSLFGRWFRVVDEVFVVAVLLVAHAFFSSSGGGFFGKLADGYVVLGG
mmetsp:Transcript_21271/g.44375  ORF Transcript_21271/g.44375 Transcript_21271/m.44375 type:complete len:510 (+) Transcript_21271:943-2472(+)